MGRNRRIGWIVGGTITAVLVTLCVLAAGVVVLCAGLGSLASYNRYQPCVPGRPEGITVTHLVGTYTTDDGGRLVLAADGTFTSSGVTYEDVHDVPGKLSGPGEWRLQAGGDGFGDIRLGFTDFRYGASLRISGTLDEPWLYWFVSDPDLCVIYRFDRVAT